MSTIVARTTPPDQLQREQALDPVRSILVRAPAGSGKTDLLTRRFLRLLSGVADPTHIVAITFTKDAAAEMRHRILAELEKAATRVELLPPDEFSMETLAARALEHSRALNWNLLEVPAQLRISTIDSFCRELALQEPLLSGFGGTLDVSEEPGALYRRAARQTLNNLGSTAAPPALINAIETLLLWRDNNWHELEEQLVRMLRQRDRWMHGFVLERDPDWEQLRARLEAPLMRALAPAIQNLAQLLNGIPGACGEIHSLARHACVQKGFYQELAELAEFPCGPYHTAEELETARLAYLCVAKMFLTSGEFRKPRGIDARQGFPAKTPQNRRMVDLLNTISSTPGMAEALKTIDSLPAARYTEEEWEILRACFTLLRYAAAELRIIFAQAGAVDFIEIAQIAQSVLQSEDHLPSESAFSLADNIHHLLVDEFQDTSRRQHALIGSLVAAWSDPENRTIFVVGDPMQSIYFFRDADAELFPRVQNIGLDLPGGERLALDFVPLTANFRTAPDLVNALNDAFEKVFGIDDGSDIEFSAALPARSTPTSPQPRLHLHLEFIPQSTNGRSSDPDAQRRKRECADLRNAAQEAQVAEIVALIQSHKERIQQARERGEKYRVAVLGRTRTSLAPIARALRDAAIPFAAVDLEMLAERPEVLDALALARALLNPLDRVSWLGVLRAPWCGLSLSELHAVAGADDPTLHRRALPQLLTERLHLLSDEGKQAAQRVLDSAAFAATLRATSPISSLGTWLQQVWKHLGGDTCVNAIARANLNLLWSALDRLPAAEVSLLGPEFGAVLADLTAQPDPEASSDYGVQVMTIHKSKGLEFEVVIVPDLQSKCQHTRPQFLSWLERGLTEPDNSGDTTEFLVAPIQTKGADRGAAKSWVDRAICTRESQEIRRILYVAATRARDELHLFARPAYKTEADGSLTLCNPPESLLDTAWPAFADKIHSQFDQWQSHQQTDSNQAIAAQAEIFRMPRPPVPAILRRLPAGFEPPAYPRRLGAETASPREIAAYTRHEGGLVSRALGTAVHAFFEQLAQLRVKLELNEALTALSAMRPRILASIRSYGIPQQQAGQIATQSHEIVLRASSDPIAAWILSPHALAQEETRWTGLIDGALRTVQVDRIFRAGEAPHAPGDAVWWIVDYKTTHPEGVDSAAMLPTLRAQFAPQLELYARMLRNLQGASCTIRAGLYYPRLLQFDFWSV